MNRRQKVWRNRIIVFGVIPLAIVVLLVNVINKKPVDERGVEVPDGLELTEDGFLVEKDVASEGPTVDEETAWATANNGMPEGWLVWVDEIKGKAVEKYGPNKTGPSYIVKIEESLVDSLPSPHGCVPAIEGVTYCFVGNHQEVERYYRVLEYYYAPDQE